MANQEAYFKCEYCGQQYTKEQFQSLRSSFAQGYEHDEEYGKIICGKCSATNLASRSGGFDGPLTVAEKIEPSIFDDETPEYDFDEIVPDDYIEIEDHQYVLPVQPPPQKPQKFRLTDVGNAKRLESIFGKDIRYSGGGWYYWNGKYWQKDADGMLMRLAKKTADNIFEEAELAPESERKEILQKSRMLI